MRRVGQENASEAAGKAAGDAAADEAKKAKWPPTKDDAKRIGGAVGAAAAGAACVAGGAVTYGATTALEAAGICSAIGDAIGTVVGGAVYDLVDSWFGTSDATQRNLDAIHRKEAFETAREAAKNRLSALAMQYGLKYNTPGQEYIELKRWGMRDDRGYGWNLQTNDMLSRSLRLLFIAESARAAEIVGANTKKSSKNSPAAIITLGVVSFLGVGLLQKFITRGKF